MSCVLNFLIENFLILTYDLGSNYHTMKDSPFHVTCVVGFRNIFVANLGALFMTKTSKNGKVSFASTFIVNFMVGLRLLRW
jgi:hypothetical protein